MLAVMAKSRLVVLIEPELHDALRLESALSGKDMAEIVEELLRTNLVDALTKIRERRRKEKKRDDD